MRERHFADVSSWQGPLRMRSYAAGHYPLIAIKATEGEDYVNPLYVETALHAHEFTVPVWHYHFCRPDTDTAAVGEAAHFWRTVRPHYQPGDRLVLDIELHHPAGADALNQYLRLLDSRLHHISGIGAVGYTYDDFLREHGRTLQVLSAEWWIANYSARPGRLGAGRRMIAWQQSDGVVGPGPHRFAGINGPCDGSLLDPGYRWSIKALARRK